MKWCAVYFKAESQRSILIKNMIKNHYFWQGHSMIVHVQLCNINWILTSVYSQTMDILVKSVNSQPRQLSWPDDLYRPLEITLIYKLLQIKYNFVTPECFLSAFTLSFPDIYWDYTHYHHRLQCLSWRFSDSLAANKLQHQAVQPISVGRATP